MKSFSSKNHIRCSDSKENLGSLIDAPKTIENPSQFGRADFEKEVEENWQRNRKRMNELLEQEKEADPVLRKWLEKFHNILDALPHSEAEWMLLHELPRLFPEDLDRETNSVSPALQHDIDEYIEAHFGLERYVSLKKRLHVLISAERKRKLTHSEKQKLHQIGVEMSALDLPDLYIAMRNKGYTRKELNTLRGPEKYQ